MTEKQLTTVRSWIINNIMRNKSIMFSDERYENDVDPIEVIASLYELLHREVTGEKYEYMFHWANLTGSWVEETLFTNMIKE